MKKKILFILALLILFVSYANGYGIIPVAIAKYMGTTATVSAYDLWLEQKQRAKITLSEVKKLTKEESKLLWDALNEYDYKVGEIYDVIMYWFTDGGSIVRSMTLYVEIQKDGSVIWCGWE